MRSTTAPRLAAEPDASRSILFVDDEPLIGRAVAHTLRRHGYHVRVATSGAEALAVAKREFFPVVMTDLRMPGMDGFTLIEQLQSLSPSSVYVIVTGLPDLDLRRGREADRSILGILSKPWDDGEVVEAVARAWEVFASREPTPAVERSRLLLVEDDPDDALIVERVLAKTGVYEVHTCDRLQEAVRHARENVVDVIVTDLSLPDARGLDAIMRLRQICPDAPLIALSGLDDEAVALQAVRLGAQDFCLKNGVRAARDLGRAIRMATERKHAERQLRYLADYDGLTGLANRSTFRRVAKNALARARRGAGAVGIGVVDLDRFKEINDTLGHDAGDAVLQAVATRLSGAVREYDLVARTGGDEFAFVLDDLVGPADAERVVERMLGALIEPLSVEGRVVTPRASVGIALFPGGGRSVAELLKAADAAMYDAKSQGPNRYVTHFGDRASPVMQRFRLEAELRRAVEVPEIHVAYQPQLDLETGRLVAFEALARWERSDGAACPPSDFVPALERTGLIHEAGMHILRSACARLAEWQGDRPWLRMAVNVSPIQLDRPGFARAVGETLGDHGLDPATLELEITESTLMRDTEMTRESLGALTRLGVRLAVDDFGTGYSSLRYLQRFAVDALKIDRGFVADVSRRSDSSIPAAVVALGSKLGIGVVAEGVETVEQLERLRTYGCKFAQGFLLGRPRADWTDQEMNALRLVADSPAT